DRSDQNKTRSRQSEDQKFLHHDPLDAGCDATTSAPFPPPRKIVTRPVSEFPFVPGDLGNNGLISLSRVKVAVGVALDESETRRFAVESSSWSGRESAASGVSWAAGTKLRRLNDNLPISLARAITSLCFGVTSSVAVWATAASPALLSSRWSMAITRTSCSTVSAALC